MTTKEQFLETLQRDGEAHVSFNDMEFDWAKVLEELIDQGVGHRSHFDNGFFVEIVGNREGRAGENNPMPTAPAENACVQDEVIRLIEERRRIGVERYGQPLRLFNGRSALVDLRDELIDAVMYVTQLIMEDEVRAKEERIGG